MVCARVLPGIPTTPACAQSAATEWAARRTEAIERAKQLRAERASAVVAEDDEPPSRGAAAARCVRVSLLSRRWVPAPPPPPTPRFRLPHASRTTLVAQPFCATGWGIGCV